MRLKVLLLFSKNSAARHKDKTVTSKNQITRQFYLFTASHWREQACLVPQRSMKIWQFVAVTPGLLPSFERFCSSKKTKHQTPRMQKQAPTVFIKKIQSICSKTVRILINIKHWHTAAPEPWPEHLKRRAMVSGFSFPASLVQTFLVFTSKKSHLIL